MRAREILARAVRARPTAIGIAALGLAMGVFFMISAVGVAFSDPNAAALSSGRLDVSGREPFGLEPSDEETAEEASSKPARNGAWLVKVDGETVGFVDDPEMLASVIRRLAARAKTSRSSAGRWTIAGSRRASGSGEPSADGITQVRLLDERPTPASSEAILLSRVSVTLEPTGQDAAPTSLEALESKLASVLRYDVVAHAHYITVEGRRVAATADQETAEAAIEDVREYYRRLIESSSGSIVKSLEVVEDTFVEPGTAHVEDLLSRSEAAAFLRTGSLVRETYEVRPGDSFWTIAEKTGMNVDDLIAANPGKKPASLKPGDLVSVTALKPYLTVRTVEEASETASIAFSVELRKDDNMPPWERRVIRQGSPGRKMVVREVTRENGKEVSSRTIWERVEVQPVAEIVAAGASQVAHRGTGRFIWPASGGLTSGFGSRRGGFHSGIDIGAPRGSTVLAADSGVVVHSGWISGYGNCVMVDHGGGFLTLYAHLASSSVSTGKQVSKGEGIGKVGSTGNSTGPHLHFEIRRNGQPVDPLNFFK